MRLKMPGGLGDELTMTAFVRELKRRRPDEMIRIETDRRAQVWKGNPYINWGNADDAKVLEDDFQAWPLATFARRYARILGFDLVDDVPEIYLTPEERAIEIPPVDRNLRTVVIDTGAGWASRRWPLERFQELARLLARQGWKVLDITSPAQVLEGALGLSTWKTVREKALILERASLYVGNDSGLFHLAAAVGTPQVVVFGSIPWQHRAYWNTTSVSDWQPCEEKCLGRTSCARISKPSHKKTPCLERIQAGQVLEAVQVAAKRFLGRLR